MRIKVRGKSEIYKRNLEVLEHKEREWESELELKRKRKLGLFKKR